MSHETNIKIAFFKQTAVASANLDDPLPVKFPLRTFNPPNNGRYIEIVQIPNNPDNVSWGLDKEFAGLFRILLHWMPDETGIIVPTLTLENISTYFAKNTRLIESGTIVTIVDHPQVSGEIIAGADLILPLTVRYSVFVAE